MTAINFPSTPTTNQTFTTSSGTTYRYDGTSWNAINTTHATGGFRKLDSIASQFNGSTTTFNLTVSGTAATPGNEQNLIIVIGGIPQEPGTAFTVSGTTITFTSAPTAGMTFYGVLLGDVMNVGVPSDGTITTAKIADLNVTTAKIANSAVTSAKLDTNISVAGNLSYSGTLTGSTGVLNVGTGQIYKDASGNIGIGTSSPLSLMHLNKGSGAADIRLSVANSLYGIMYASASDFTINSYSAIPLTFGTNNTERVRIDTSGNVGIGTSSPTSFGAGYTTLTLTGSTAGVFQTKTTGNDARFYANSTETLFGNWALTPIRFVTNSAEVMRLDAAGNLGINNTSPSTFGKVTIQVPGTTTPSTVTDVGPNSVNLYAAANGGSTDSTVGIFGWQASPGIGSGIGFSRENSGNWGSQIRFYTHPTATSNLTSVTEIARLTAAGHFELSGNLSFVGPSSSVRIHLAGGSPTSSNTGIAAAWNVHSDYRLKDDIEPIMNAIDQVVKLNPVFFTWIEDQIKVKTAGFLAHQLQEVAAYSVLGDKDAVTENGDIAPQSADYSKIVPLLTAAIIELVERVKILENR